MKNSAKKEFRNLKRSAKTFKIYSRLLLVSLLTSVIFKPTSGNQTILYLFDLIIGLPVLLTIFLVPMGLFFSLKSFKLNEGTKISRLKNLYGHLFFFILILLFLAVMVSDFRKLF